MHLSIDPDRCTGCRLCEIYCSVRHEGRAWPELARIHVLKDELTGAFIPLACLPCEAHACLAACPTPGAMRLETDGMVTIQTAMCTGCARCVRACALGAIQWVRLDQTAWDGAGFPLQQNQPATPQPANGGGRAKGGKAVALKCDRCGGDPACVAICPTGALRLVTDGAAQPLHDQLAARRAQVNATLVERGAAPARRQP